MKQQDAQQIATGITGATNNRDLDHFLAWLIT
jgi:hypothetical protein